MVFSVRPLGLENIALKRTLKSSARNRTLNFNHNYSTVRLFCPVSKNVRIVFILTFVDNTICVGVNLCKLANTTLSRTRINLWKIQRVKVGLHCKVI